MTNPKEATREALPVVAWLYYEGDADAIPKPGQDVWRSIFLSLSRHDAYRNETPLVRLTDAQSALESERQAHAAEVERLRADAEWISVADRMPPPITTVIAHGRQYGDHGRHPKVYTTYTGTRVRETVEDEEITHWMPLPAAPNQGENHVG